MGKFQNYFSSEGARGGCREKPPQSHRLNYIAPLPQPTKAALPRRLPDLPQTDRAALALPESRPPYRSVNYSNTCSRTKYFFTASLSNVKPNPARSGTRNAPPANSNASFVKSCCHAIGPTIS